MSPHVVPGPETNINFGGFTPGIMEGFRGYQGWSPGMMGGGFYGPQASARMAAMMGGPGGGLGPQSIYDVYQSAIPTMELNRDKQVWQAMTEAGMTGGRYGTPAMREAGRIGAETSLSMNEMLTNLLYQQGQQDAQRALQAAQMSIGLGGNIEDALRSRIGQLGGLGQFEMGRGQQLAQTPFNEFMQSRMGWIPQLLSAAPGGLSPSVGPQQVTGQEAAQPGFMDYLISIGVPLLAAGIGASDRRVKREIKDVSPKKSRAAAKMLKTFAYKSDPPGTRRLGFVAQDVEKVHPRAVLDVSGVKHIDFRELGDWIMGRQPEVA